jgi:hypothetical protein
MAHLPKNHLLHGSQGAIGKRVVLKTIGGETFACKYPDMTRVQFNENQKKCQSVFGQAVKYAKTVLMDTEKLKEYQQKQRDRKELRPKSIYHLALQDFIDKNSSKKSKRKTKELLRQYQHTYNLTERQYIALQQLIETGSLTNSIYQQINQVSKATATRDLQDLVQQGILTIHSKGAGATYALIGSSAAIIGS